MRLCILVLRSILPLVILLAASVSTAHAQIYEAVGIRAQGMGGAFVAVADDATASWWNPAGVATGAYFSSVLEFDRLRQPDSDRNASGQPQPAWRAEVRTVAAAFPALALSYYRLRISEVRGPGSTAAPSASREDQGAGEVHLRTLALTQFGATAGQSLGSHFVIASTLKLLRGRLGAVVRPAVEATLDRAEELSGDVETRLDLDAGVMASMGHVRIGLAVKNLTKPSFGGEADRLELGRQTRLGLAFSTTPSTRTAGVTVAADADLSRTVTVLGDERRLATGVEAWSAGHVFIVRGGVSGNTIGDAHVTLSGGASVRVRPTTFVDVQTTRGNDQSRHGWGIGLRVMF